MVSEQQSELVQSVDAAKSIDVKAPVSEETKKKNLEQYASLMADAQKSMIVSDYDKAVDHYSDAARLADVIYGEFAPESFDSHLKYGVALVYWGLEQYPLVRMNQGEDESSDDEEESGEEEDFEMEIIKIGAATEGTSKQAEDTAVNKQPVDEKVVEEESEQQASEKATDGNAEEKAEHDESVVLQDLEDEIGEDQPLDEFDEIMQDAWHVLEVAKKTCERVLEANPDEKETRNWELKLSEAFYNLGQIMLLSDQPQDAKKEFFSSLDIKKKYLDSTDRELASVYFDLAKAFESCNEFSDAKAQYGTALESLSKKIELLVASNDEAVAKEIEELKALCTEVRDKIADVLESEKSDAEFKQLAKDNMANSLPPLNPAGDDAPINDVSALVRKRAHDSIPAGTKDGEENAFKKSKVGRE